MNYLCPPRHILHLFTIAQPELPIYISYLHHSTHQHPLIPVHDSIHSNQVIPSLPNNNTRQKHHAPLHQTTTRIKPLSPSLHHSTHQTISPSLHHSTHQNPQTICPEPTADSGVPEYVLVDERRITQVRILIILLFWCYSCSRRLLAGG